MTTTEVIASGRWQYSNYKERMNSFVRIADKNVHVPLGMTKTIPRKRCGLIELSPYNIEDH